jgi:hypothetical protein
MTGNDRAFANGQAIKKVAWMPFVAICGANFWLQCSLEMD